MRYIILLLISLLAASATQAQTYSNPASIAVPGGGATVGPASPYPSNITVAGFTGTVTKATVTLTNVNHTFPDDIDILLVGPGGQSVILMSDTGGNPDLTNVNLTFDDAAAASLPDNEQIVSGTYKPTDFEAGDTFPAPAPGGPYGATLAAFNGRDPNGTWSLYVVDDLRDDVGSIAGGWSLTLQSSQSTYSNPASIAVPGGGATVGPASPYPSNITVAGFTGTVTKATVTLTNVNHTFPDDIDILLVGPGGQSVILMSDTGGNPDLTNVNLTFDDAAAASLPDNEQIVSGTYKPTDFEAGDTFPAPAPGGPYGATLAAFNGTNPNGTWSLYVVDDASLDFGSIAGGWSLTLQSAPTTAGCSLIGQQATLTRQDGGGSNSAGPTTVQAGSVEFNGIPFDERFSVDVEGTSVGLFNTTTDNQSIEFNSPSSLTISVPGSQTIAGINSVTINGVTNFTPQNVSFTSNSVTFNVAGAVFNSGTSVVANLRFNCTTAATVSVSGRVTARGRGISNAVVHLTNQKGEIQTVKTSRGGYYTFAELAAGETYIFNVFSKRYQFDPKVINLTEDLSELDFTAQ